MTARTVVQGTSGATIAISATLPATYDGSGYGSTLMVYTTIGEVENHGEHGITVGTTTFTPVGTAVVTKIKTTKDYGNKSLALGNVPANAGQILLDTAVESYNHYSVKITYPLGDGEVTAEIHYLDVLVTKNVIQDGSVSDVRKRSVEFAICRKPVIVAAT